MDEKRSISKDVLFDIFKNQNEAALRSPTPSHLLNRSGKNSAFRTPPLGSTPVNYNIPLHPRTEHLFLNQSIYNTSADNYGPEENFPSSVVTTSDSSPSSVYLPHPRNLGRGFTEATSSTIIPGNSLQNPLSFNSFQPNSHTTETSLRSSHERMENQPKHPIRPLPMRGTSSQLHYTIDLKPSNLITNDNCIFEKIDDTLSIKDNNNSAIQDEENNFNNEDLKLIDNQHDFELLDKGKQVIRETESNQIEQASDDNRLELTKWHLKVISIKDTLVPEVKIPEGIDFWVVLSGIVRGTRDKWHSDVITARENNRLVQTAKDKSYLLDGKLLSKKMQADGFSEGLIKAFEDGFPENWQELLFADLRSSSFSFKESHETKPPPEKRVTPRQKSKISPNKRRFKAPTVQNQGEIVTSSGRHIRAPGNWWEVSPKPKVKEGIAEPKRQRLSTGKRISERSQKRRSSQKDNATKNMREDSEETNVDMPRHEVYVLVETSKSK